MKVHSYFMVLYTFSSTPGIRRLHSKLNKNVRRLHSKLNKNVRAEWRWLQQWCSHENLAPLVMRQLQLLGAGHQPAEQPVDDGGAGQRLWILYLGVA